MTGTDEAEAAATAADEALYVLTAALLTPAQFPSVLGDDYPEACAALGLGPYAQGYGLVLGQDGAGARWTVVIDDVSLVAVAIASWDCGMEYELSPDERTVVAALPGWPLELVVSAPNVPAPHDPEPDPEGPPTLTPPDTSQWGPAQRRLGADAVAVQWTTWREQLDDDTFGPPPTGEPSAAEPSTAATIQAPDHNPGEPSPTASGDSDEGEGGSARASDEVVDKPVDPAGEEGGPADRTGGSLDDEPDAETGHHHDDGEPRGVRRVLAELRGYVDSAPPVGRVRSGFAPGGARTLRADGPGWSLVARTDDVAFVLLDECPGDVHPVGRDEGLPALLASLEAMAVHPA
ncbi:hypothetical protein [Streptomyces sp. NBC_00083]|uniref:hypothetical protein n=1 Tax=Streptomyces sp. NBC_00083 TaxID=2975647 RepID=UPI00225C0A6E|nr:hypothetical protein [Streptomyces sp. NBC_00083]MCX5384211.1 hypothetical protein [Streptomyces sp. NBC_00083]